MGLLDTVRSRTGRSTPDPLEVERRRFARRRRRQRLFTWRHVLVVLALLALASGLVWLVFFSSHLAVKKVTVQGTSYLRPSTVKEAADLPTGEPLATVDLARAKDLVSALRAVREVDVTRQWPSTIRITVTEREPVAVVQTGELIRGMDDEGVLFRDYAKRPGNLPLVQAAADADEKALAEAAEVAGALPADLNRRVTVLNVDSVDAISLQLRNGKQILWGSADDSELKAKVLVALLKEPGRVYDVSAPSLATVRD